jgi:hypothetical protein
MEIDDLKNLKEEGIFNQHKFTLVNRILQVEYGEEKE